MRHFSNSYTVGNMYSSSPDYMENFFLNSLFKETLISCLLETYKSNTFRFLRNTLKRNRSIWGI